MDNNSLLIAMRDLFGNIINDQNIDVQTKTIDLTTKEGKTKFNELVDTIENNSLFKLMYTLVGGDNFENDMQTLKDFANNVKLKEEEEKPQLKKPSELLDNVDVKLQLHKLVEEYTNTYIKPYVSDDESGKQLANDAYAGLFEYSCWLYNK